MNLMKKLLEISINYENRIISDSYKFIIAKTVIIKKMEIINL